MDHARSQPAQVAPLAQANLLIGRAVDWALVVVLALLPFELKVGINLSGLLITNSELLISAALGLWLLLLASERRLPIVPRRLWLPIAIVVATLLMSALLAQHFRGAALKFSLRQVQGALLAICVAERLLLGGTPLAHRLVRALLAGCGVSALLGLVEMSEIPFVLAALDIFKEKPTLMGGLLRLSATFAYANIAAMYFEALLPFALIWAASWGQGTGDKGQGTRDKGLGDGSQSPIPNPQSPIPNPQSPIPNPQSKIRSLLPAALFLATLLTFSRASFVTALALVVGLPLVAWFLFWQKRSLPSAFVRRLGLLAGGLLLLLGLLIVMSPVMRLRLTSPDVTRWHDVSYAPQPLPALAPNEVITSNVTLTNSGWTNWRASGVRPFALSYHWLDAKTRRIVRYDGIRTPLPRTVAPGESITLAAAVQAPEQAGRYILAWDMVQEGANWLSEQGAAVTEIPVEVAGSLPTSSTPRQVAPPPPAEAGSIPQQLAVELPPPDRGPLWRAAITLWRERPIVGIGPDTFRHVYGPLLGLQSFDNRIHTNNLYIEILVGGGIIGLAAAGLLLWCVLAPAVRSLFGPRTEGRGPRTEDRLPTAHCPLPTPHSPLPTSPASLLLLGSLGGIAAFLIHGLLDMFLEYTPTYALLWLLLGMTVAWSTPQGWLGRK